MADVVDVSDVALEAGRAAQEKAIRDNAARIPAGEAGECDLCGEYFSRTVHGVCARCRDAHDLP